MVRFMWEGCEDNTKKVPWVSWDRICRPKEYESLGIRNLVKVNLALLSKWRWRIHCDKESAWCQILWAKYGDKAGNGSHYCMKNTSLWWKDLWSLCVDDVS